MLDLLIRFVLGGAVVSAFAAVAELFHPKTFSGIFGAAPSVAIATLGLTFAQGGAPKVAVEARWMAIACAAMLAYCALSASLARRPRVPVWLAAAVSWIAWLAVALVLYVAVGGARP